MLVAAASDLAKVSRPLATEFQRSSGRRVTFVFGSSGQLEQQIRHGAPYDLYAPAARSFCKALERDGLTDGPEKPYALGRLVVWSKKIELQKLDELKDSRIERIAIANPSHAPYGAAAQQTFERTGLWPALQPKMVFGENVLQTLQLAQTGNVEAALIAIALAHKSDGFILPVDPTLHEPIEQAAVVLKGSQNKQTARAFVDFLLTPEAQSILREYGFMEYSSSNQEK
ncbi:MAG: molybdate ABC transporter substrate-binding protein [Acidobacteria bacterium]|nr:molybdate ABC transporter substrate-binding protein [Acidobacteriota bacterium]